MATPGWRNPNRTSNVRMAVPLDLGVDSPEDFRKWLQLGTNVVAGLQPAIACQIVIQTVENDSIVLGSNRNC